MTAKIFQFNKSYGPFPIQSLTLTQQKINQLTKQAQNLGAQIGYCTIRTYDTNDKPHDEEIAVI